MKSKGNRCLFCDSKTSTCQCISYYLHGVTQSMITEVACSRGKYRTIISGNFEEGIAKVLKKKLGCGGLYFNNKIELQGKHKNNILSLTSK